MRLYEQLPASERHEPGVPSKFAPEGRTSGDKRAGR